MAKTPLKLLPDPALVLGSGAIYPYSEELNDLCGRFTRFGDPYSMARTIEIQGVTHLLVPRGLAPSAQEDVRVEGAQCVFSSAFTPRNAEQARVIAESLLLLSQGKNFVVESPTATGKTWMAMDIISKVRRKTIVVVTNTSIRDQWVTACEKVLGLKLGEGVGLIQGDRCDVQGALVVVAMVQSIAREGRYPPATFQDFGLMIVDECFHPSHELLTSTGWKPVSEVTLMDKVAQVDPISGLLSYSFPEKVIAKGFAGNLVGIEGVHCSLLATPTHQHFGYRDGVTPDKVYFSEFIPSGTLHTMYAPNVSPEGGSLTAEERLWLAYQADGTLLHRSKKGVYTVRFSFRKERKIERLRGILSEMALPYSETVNGRGDTSFTLRLPYPPSKSLSWIGYERSGRWCREALEEVALWDGWHQGAGIHFESSYENAEMIRVVAMLAGKMTSVKKVRKAYRMSAWPGNVRSSKSLRKYKFPYVGEVYCVRMPHGTVVTRRSGRVCITGNCHRIGSEFFSQACYRVPAKLRMGLSATPDRSDGKEGVIHAHIGPVLVRSTSAPMTPRIILKRSPWEVPYVRKIENGAAKVVQVPHTAAKSMHVIKMLTKHKERNAELVRFILAAYRKERRVLVQSDITEHLNQLHHLLIQSMVPQSDIGFYLGGMRKEMLDVAATRPIVLSTYSMTKEGVDIPWLDTLVMATPKSDVRQIAGRILRFLEGKKEPVIFDMVDMTSTVFYSFWRKRMKWYASIGAAVDNAKLV